MDCPIINLKIGLMNYQNCSQLPVKFKSSSFEVFIVIQEGFITRIQTVIGAVGKNAEKFLKMV